MTKKILVVEDNQDTATLVKVVLERAGYQTEVAYNGEQGLISVREMLPDLILLDIMMPVMDGITMNRRLAEDPSTKPIPIIVMSARDDVHSPSFDTLTDPRIAGYLVKPINSKMLLSKIKEVLKT